MGRLSLFSLALACAAGCSAIASASDLPPEISLPEAGTVSAGTGLYLRGDLGYAWTGDEDAVLEGAAAPVSGFDNERFSHPVSFGAGIGYQFTDVLRADLSVETFKDRFGADGGCGAGCAASFGADYRGVGVMANGYVDLATIAGFTPYVGAGLGATRLSWSDAGAAYRCLGGPGTCAGEGAQAFDGGSEWRFTYAVMAGVSYALNERVKIDFGYRYSDLAGGGNIRSGAMHGADDGFSRHEIRAGLRFALW